MKTLIVLLILFCCLVFSLAFIEEVVPTVKINFSKEKIIENTPENTKITSFLVFPTSIYQNVDE